MSTPTLDQAALDAATDKSVRGHSYTSAKAILGKVCSSFSDHVSTALTLRESAMVIAPRLITVMCDNEERLASWTGATIRHIRNADARMVMRRFEAENLIMWCQRVKEITGKHGIVAPNDGDIDLVDKHCEAVTALLGERRNGRQCLVGLMGLAFFTRIQRWMEMTGPMLPPGAITSEAMIEAVADEMLEGYNTAPNAIVTTGSLRASELMAVVFGLTDRPPTVMGYA